MQLTLASPKFALHFVLADGREVSAPLEWFRHLRDSNDAVHKKWRLIGNEGCCLPTLIDEDISIKAIMTGSE